MRVTSTLVVSVACPIAAESNIEDDLMCCKVRITRADGEVSVWCGPVICVYACTASFEIGGESGGGVVGEVPNANTFAGGSEGSLHCDDSSSSAVEGGAPGWSGGAVHFDSTARVGRGIGGTVGVSDCAGGVGDRVGCGAGGAGVGGDEVGFVFVVGVFHDVNFASDGPAVEVFGGSPERWPCSASHGYVGHVQDIDSVRVALL